MSDETVPVLSVIIDRLSKPPLRGVISTLLLPQSIFLFVALATMGPLLSAGRILALDSPLALNWDIGGYFWGTSDGAASVFGATYNSAPIAILLTGLDYFLPFWLVEKSWLVLLFWLCGYGASRLPYLQGSGRYYAGIFYTLNPFTYSRFVTGQWGILGAYALTPFAVTSFIRLLEDPQPRRAVVTALVLTGISFLQVHGLILVMLVLAIIYAARLITARSSFRRTLPGLVLTAVLFLGINLFWIVRYAIAGGGVVKNILPGEFVHFAAGPLLDVVSLRGFWKNFEYTDIADLIPVWWVLFLFLLAIAIFGIFRIIQRTDIRWLGCALLATGIVSVGLAAGPSISVIETLFIGIWDQFPLYRAFRDSHKFVALLALVYAYGGGFGLHALQQVIPHTGLWRGRISRAVGGVALITVAIFALPIFGTWGQLEPTDFPAEWFEARSVIEKDLGDQRQLHLPVDDN